MVPIGGTELHVLIEGRPGADWVVLSHALATNLTSWDAIAAALADRYRLLRYDTRGHGRSKPVDDATAESMTFDRLASDVVGLLDHFSIDRTDFIGVSMGGMTALGLGLSAPGRMRSLTAIGARADTPAPMQQVWADRIASVRTGGMEALVDATLVRWFPAEFRSAKPDVIETVAAMIRSTSPSGYVACANALKRLAYLPRLGGVRTPTLLLAGGKDEPMPVAMKAMVEIMPDARFHVVEGTGHLTQIEQPETVLAHIEAFLASRR